MINELRSIANNLHEQRPDWDLPGILTVLARLDITAAHLPGVHDIDRIRQAAERVAHDPKAKTPAAISFARYWRTEPGPLGPLPECAHCRTPRRRNVQPTRCARCGRLWHEKTP